MTDTTALKNFQKTKDYFVGIDSDGCAFDSMEIKQKECFIPNNICHWNLQPVSSMARETAEFVNLYSQWRGINRFPAMVKVLDLLAERPDAIERGYRLPNIDPLREWIKTESRLGDPALEAKVRQTQDPILIQTLAWSKAINETVARIVKNVPPFPHVVESLQKLQSVADVMVVSATPGEALNREWQEHNIAKYAKLIAGQEMGTKKEHLKFGAVGKYKQDNILMIGDAPGDMKAARDNNVLFYPINPGSESKSWKRFHDEAMDRFLTGRYKGEYEDALVKEFMALLPSIPPWKNNE